MRRLSVWKMLVPPAVVPLALSMFVALAGPGGIVEVSDDGGSSSAAAGATGGSVDDNGDVVDSGAGVDGGVDAAEETDPDGGANEGSGSGENNGSGKGCEQALADRAKSRDRLEDHVADKEKPAGGVDGNQKALDHQCGGALAEGSEETTEESADSSGTGPGKSEQVPGGPAANGQANGSGQANADVRGSGPEAAPGKNKP